MTVFTSCLFANISSAQEISDRPETPFKLATFSLAGVDRIGMVLDENIIDLNMADKALGSILETDKRLIPEDMKGLIENYDTFSPRLYKMANYLKDNLSGHQFIYNLEAVRIKAPVKYPWNLIAAATNYRMHAEEMGIKNAVDPDRDAPYVFAKSPRSSIIDPGAAYVIPEGRSKIDWEGELAIVMGKPTTNITLDNAMDYVFGFTIMYDVSDREPLYRKNPSFGVDWFAMKSRNNSAPMGPFIVPKEFLPNYKNLKISTRINGRVVQDSNTSYMIFDVEHLVRHVSSIMTLYPGDVIATGTPDGVGAGRKPQEFLKSGDLVRIDIEGIGSLETPIE